MLEMIAVLDMYLTCISLVCQLLLVLVLYIYI